MKIAIEARGLAGVSGTQTYIRELIYHLAKIATHDQLEIWRTDSSATRDVSNVTTKLLPLKHELLLPLWIRQVTASMSQGQPDVLHFTKPDIPARKQNIPTVVTIHDVIPLLLPQTQSPIRRWYWRSAFKRVAKFADHILTVSEAAKRQIVERLEIEPTNITVTPNGVNTNHFKPIDHRLPGLQEEYLLFVGRWDERKNVSALIQAFANISDKIPHQLVLAGRPADKPVDLAAVVRRASVTDRVQFLENVAYDDLPALYTGAS